MFVLSNTLRPRQIGHQLADDMFKYFFLNENASFSIKVSLMVLPEGPIDNNPAFVQILVWRRLGDTPLSEPMMVRLLTHICTTRPQWFNMKSYTATRLIYRAACDRVSGWNSFYAPHVITYSYFISITWLYWVLLMFYTGRYHPYPSLGRHQSSIWLLLGKWFLNANKTLFPRGIFCMCWV